MVWKKNVKEDLLGDDQDSHHIKSKANPSFESTIVQGAGCFRHLVSTVAIFNCQWNKCVAKSLRQMLQLELQRIVCYNKLNQRLVWRCGWQGRLCIIHVYMDSN